VAYFIQSGFDYTASTGPSNLVQYAMTALLRTFLDGGQMAATLAPGHIAQVPLLEIYLDQPNGEYVAPSAVSIVLASPVTTGIPVTWMYPITSGPITNPWFRYPGLSSTTANIYTEEYPGYSSGLTASTYMEPVTMDYYLKWSNDNQHWWYVQDNTLTTLGQPDPNAAADNNKYRVSNSSSFPISYVWNVGVTQTFPQGTYWLTAEAYRENYPLHYANHQVVLTFSR
jgi:hypothetical protein